MCEARSDAFGWAIITLVHVAYKIYRVAVKLWLGIERFAEVSDASVAQALELEPGFRAARPESHSRNDTGSLQTCS